MTACDEVTVLERKASGNNSPGGDEQRGLVKLMFMERDIEITETALPKIDLPRPG